MAPVLLLVGLAVASLLAVSWRTRWRESALWTALLLAGQAATLTLIEAGPFVRYQHLKSPGRWGDAPLAVALLLLEGVAVAVALRRHWPSLRAWLGTNRSPAALAFVAAAFTLTAATVSANPRVFALELITATLLQALHLGAALMVGLRAPSESSGFARLADRLLGSPEVAGRRGAPLDGFMLALAGLAVLVPALLAVLSYQRHPHIPDEVVYLLQARYLAAGELGLPVPAPFAAFDLDLMFAHRGRWVSPFPVGWPAVLAIGVRLGAPWLVNPLLTGLNVVLVYLFLHEILDRRAARLGTVLFALSPWNLLLGMSFMAHPLTLCAALLAALGVARWKRGAGYGWALLGGIGIGMVSLIRPLDGVIVGGLLGLWALFTHPWPRLLTGLAALGLGALVLGGLGLAYNAAITGSPTRFPVMTYFDQVYGPGSNALGFGPERGVGWAGLDPYPGHDLLDVFINANLNSFALNIELFGWASGAIWLVALGLVAGPWARGERLMVAAIAGVIGLHALYWFSGGPDFGPRYWYLTIVPCVGLAAKGLLALAPSGESAPAAARSRGLTVAAALVAGTLVVFIPWRAVDKYRGFRGMRPDLGVLAKQAGFGRSLVLINGKRAPDLASAAVFNPLDLDADAPIYAWDRSPEVRQALLGRYPDRPVWLVVGPTLAGGRFRIRAGPFAPGSALPPLGPSQSSFAHSPADSLLVLRNVTVIDATGAPPAPGRTVVVERGRIRAIVASQGYRPPAGARVFDGEGKFLIPGLWDMHVHLSGAPAGNANSRYYLPLFVSFGVTGVRDMSGRLAVLRAWRDSVAQGTLLGPRMIVTGFKLGDQPVVPGAPFPIRSEADVQASIRALKQAGADFVKLQMESPDLLAAVAKESRAQGLPFVGHLSRGLSLADASRGGYRSVEHLDGLMLGASTDEDRLRRRLLAENGWWRRLLQRLHLADRDAVQLEVQREILRTLSPERAESLFALLAARPTWQVPTLSGTRDGMRLVEQEPFEAERREYLPPGRPLEPIFWNKDPELARQMFGRRLELVGQLHRAGVPLLAGTDLPGFERPPAFGLVEELELLVRAGLSPMAALQTATLEPARYLQATDSLGTIAPGKVADLVLLDENPLSDIRNVHRVHAVVLGGRLLAPAELDSLRAGVRRLAAHWRDSAASRPAGSP